MTTSLIQNHDCLRQASLEFKKAETPLESEKKLPHLHLVSTEGQLHVHSAPYRGSFSGVLSEALRTAGLGRQVLVAQFLKGGVNQGPKGIVTLCDRLEWIRPDIAGCITTKPNKISDKEAVQAIWEICKNRFLKGDVDQIVLDEVGLAIKLGYLKEDEVIRTLENRPSTMDVILTGPSIPPKAINIADQVTELRCGF